jgi:hypothetical protein
MARNYYPRRRRFNRARNFIGRTARYGARGAYWAQRAYNRGYTRFYNSRVGYGAWRANQAIGLYNPGAEYLAGAVLGLTAIDNKIPAPLKIIGAALPLRGGIGGKVSRFFRGMLIGDAVSYYTKYQIPIPGIDNAGSNIKWG